MIQIKSIRSISANLRECKMRTNTCTTGVFSRRQVRGHGLVLVCLGFLMFYYTKTWREDQIPTPTPATTRTETHVVISSYMKGGGTLLGKVLGRREDTFYSFEPLFAKSMWNYYRTSHSACKILEKQCVDVDPGSVLTAMDMVEVNYNCRTEVMVEQFYHPRWDNGGPPWRLFHQCLDDHKDVTVCNDILNTACAHASNRVVKVNRLSLRLVGELMKNNQQLKVVHVFRDPRGIISSRLNTPWYPKITSPEILKANAEGLCQRIADDLEEGTMLALMYPKRFKMILFEDFQANIENTFRQLLSFLNLRYTTQDRSNIDSIMASAEASRNFFDKGDVISNQLPADEDGANSVRVNAFQWRETIDMDSLRVIDSVCDGLYKKLGYNVYANEAQLRDVTGWPSFGGAGIPPL